MKTIGRMAAGELAAFISDHLAQHGIAVVLTGGACVSVHTSGQYHSFDIDFIELTPVDRKRLTGVLQGIGFVEKNRYFVHPGTKYFLEFPTGPLAVGREPVKRTVVLRLATGSLRLLSPTDCVKDRLAAFYHWHDRQALEQAVLVAMSKKVDLKEVGRWSKNEGMAEEFNGILDMFRTRKSPKQKG